MRKLKPSEVAVLVAGLTIGNGNVEADEQRQVIATVTVTASRGFETDVSAAFIFSSGYVPYSSPPPQSQTDNDPTTQARYQHAINCARAYGVGRGGVPKNGYVTYFANNYGWVKDDTQVYATATNQPPAGTGFVKLFGVTNHYHPAYPLIQGQSKIFMKSHATTADLINTIAHEWSHQSDPFGAPNHDKADRAGNDTEAAWRADNGAKCGGL